MSVGAVNKQTGERIPTAGMPAVDSVLSGSSTNPVQNRVVKAALDEKADTDMVAADFNAGSSYSAGNYCVQDGKLYKFKNNHSGAWSASDVDEVKITGELSALKSGLTNTQGTGIITNPGIVSAERLYWKRYGNVVVIDLDFTVGSADITVAQEELFSGFPPASSNRPRFRCPKKNGEYQADLDLCVTVEGKIINQWSDGGIKANAKYACSFTYIVD
jgi:putative hemolysin